MSDLFGFPETFWIKKKTTTNMEANGWVKVRSWNKRGGSLEWETCDGTSGCKPLPPAQVGKASSSG